MGSVEWWVPSVGGGGHGRKSSACDLITATKAASTALSAPLRAQAALLGTQLRRDSPARQWGRGAEYRLYYLQRGSEYRCYILKKVLGLGLLFVGLGLGIRG